MARAEGVRCPSCGMVRAPTIAECPRCRVVAGSPEPHDETADEGGTPSLTSLPSRALLASVPLLGIVSSFVAIGTGAPRTFSYAELGWVSSALAIGVAAIVALLVGLTLARLARRLSIGGETAHPLAIAIAMIFGLAPLVALPVYRGLESANTASMTPEEATCRWTEARQQLSRRTGAVLHVTVHARCTLPSGAGLELDIPIESARLVEGERLVVPTWRGRWYGRLVALPPP